MQYGNKSKIRHNKTPVKKVENFIKEYQEFLDQIQAYLKSKTFISSLVDLNYEFMVDQKFSLSSM